jgi:hypothetical protein
MSDDNTGEKQSRERTREGVIGFAFLNKMAKESLLKKAVLSTNAEVGGNGILSSQ